MEGGPLVRGGYIHMFFYLQVDGPTPGGGGGEGRLMSGSLSNYFKTAVLNKTFQVYSKDRRGAH